MSKLFLLSCLVGLQACTNAIPNLSGLNLNLEPGSSSTPIEVLRVEANPISGSYSLGQVVEIQIIFSDKVLVKNAVSVSSFPPKLKLETGSTDQDAIYFDGSGTNTLKFRYTVLTGDASSDLNYIDKDSLNLNTSTLIGTADQLVYKELPAATAATSLSGTSAIVVSGTPGVLVLFSGATFPNTLVNFSSSQIVTVKNQSATGVTISSMSLSDTVHFNFVAGTYPGASATCGANLTAGATCTLNISFSPQMVSANLLTNLNISFNDGQNSITNSFSLNGPSQSSFALSVEDAYTSSALWNKYIKKDGSQFYNATDTACTGAETGDYFSACLHAAEIKKVEVDALNTMTCSNLSMTDTLGAFNWICDDSNMATTGKILFYSKSLKSGKGLRNLIQAAGGSGSWISNSVQVEVTSGAQVGTIYASSSPAVWWDNPVQQLPVNTGSTASTLLSDTTHPVYVVGAGQNTEGGYQIGADGISIVTLGSAILNQTGSTFAFNCKTDGGSSAVGLDVRGIFCGYQKKYLWFEVHLDGGSVSSTNYAGAGIILNGAKLTRIQDSTLNNFNGTTVNSAISLISSSKNILINTDVYNANSALSLNSSSFNLIRNLQAARIQFTGTAKVVSLNASDSNKLTDIQISGVSTTDVAVGIYSNFSNFNIFQRVFISNIDAKLSEGKGYGILLTDAMDHILSQITIAGVEGAGIQLNGSFDNSANYLSHINFVNNTVSGLDLRGGLVSDNIYNSLVLTNNKANIWIRGDVLYPSIDNNFYNIVSTSSTDSDGSVNIDVNYQSTFIGYLISNFGGVNTCIKGTTSVVSNLTSSCLGTPESTLNSAINSFVGKITVDDVISTIDTLGQSAFSLLTTLTRWSEFAFGFRGWGNDGSVFPNSNNQGPCDGSSDCRIWDFRLKSGSALENRSFNYTSTNAAINFVGGSCTSFLDGNATFTLESRVFMKFAIELDNDNVGNDNGLCEDNEHCIYTPNIGAYQGEGMISSSNYCVTGTSTNVKNAKIFKYPTTSVP